MRIKIFRIAIVGIVFFLVILFCDQRWHTKLLISLLNYCTFVVVVAWLLILSELFKTVDGIEVLCRSLAKDDKEFGETRNNIFVQSFHWRNFVTLRLASDDNMPLQVRNMDAKDKTCIEIKYTGCDNHILYLYSINSNLSSKEANYEQACMMNKITFPIHAWLVTISQEDATVNFQSLDIQKEINIKNIRAVVLAPGEGGVNNLLFIVASITEYNNMIFIEKNKHKFKKELFFKFPEDAPVDRIAFNEYYQLLFSYRHFKRFSLSGRAAFQYHIGELLTRVEDKIRNIIKCTFSYLCGQIVAIVPDILEMKKRLFTKESFLIPTIIMVIGGGVNGLIFDESIIPYVGLACIDLALVGTAFCFGKPMKEDFLEKFNSIVTQVGDDDSMYSPRLLKVAKSRGEGVAINDLYIRCNTVSHPTICKYMHTENLKCEQEGFPCSRKDDYSADIVNFYHECKNNNTLTAANKSKFTPASLGEGKYLDDMKLHPWELCEITYMCFFVSYLHSRTEKYPEIVNERIDQLRSSYDDKGLPTKKLFDGSTAFFLHNKDPFSNGSILFVLCLHMTVMTADGYIILTQKSQAVENERSRLSFSLEEQLDSVDLNGRMPISCEHWGLRALYEELAVVENEIAESIRIFSIIEEYFHTKHCKNTVPNIALCAFAKITLTRKQLNERMALGVAPDREFSAMKFITPYELLLFLKRMSKNDGRQPKDDRLLKGYKLHSTSFVRILHFLIYYYGELIVFRMFKRNQR